MKANELMIGDWVIDAHDPQRKYKRVCIDDLNWINEYPLEPIPLTPEILEANGFVKINSQRYDFGEYESECFIKVNPKRHWIHVNGKNANCNLYSHKYVHELQHALRLCGMTELADNMTI